MGIKTDPDAEEEEGTFVLLPSIDEPGVAMSLFSDGSYTSWVPTLQWHELRRAYARGKSASESA